MEITKYSEFVKARIKPGLSILEELTIEKASLWHLGPALMIEAGELSDSIKKWAIYKKSFDRENVIEELGDIEFYLEAIRQAVGLSRELTITHNIEKLSVRYSEKFTNEEAQQRKDKIV